MVTQQEPVKFHWVKAPSGTTSAHPRRNLGRLKRANQHSVPEETHMQTGPRGHSDLHNNTKMLSASSLLTVPLMVQKQWWVKLLCLSMDGAVTPNYTIKHCIFYCLTVPKKELFHWRKSLAHTRHSINIRQALEIINLIKSGQSPHPPFVKKYSAPWSIK